VIAPVSFAAPKVFSREESFREQLANEIGRESKRRLRRIRLASTQYRTRTGIFRLLPGVSMTLGSVLLANAFWPILSYFIFVSPQLQRNRLVSPLPDVTVVRQTAIAPAQAAGPENIRPKIIRDDLDYTNLSSWFPQSENQLAQLSEPIEEKEYVISIPAVNIENARVRVGGLNLDENLIQYPGTADPGELGAPVIFGHSTLRQFYNPNEKNPRRYLSLFSKIMTLKPGDKIFIDYDNIRYTYVVQKKVEVKPEDTYILEQEYAARQLKLVTCVPEGTYLRRGIILAQLETKQ
jgi:sortase A